MDDFEELDTIRDRINNMADQYPNEPAFIFPHNDDLTLTYSEVRARVNFIMAGLQELGLGPRDRAAFLMANTHEHVLLILACGSLGIECVLLDYVSFKLTHVATILAEARTKVLFMFDSYNGSDYVTVLGQLSLPDLKHVVLVKGNDTFAHPLSGELIVSYADLVKPKALVRPFPDLNSQEPFVIIFTVSDEMFALLI